MSSIADGIAPVAQPLTLSYGAPILNLASNLPWELVERLIGTMSCSR